MFEKIFHLREQNTDIGTEVAAGVTTFMAMSYILIVNPLILSTIGMDALAVFAATAITAGVATLLMAFTTNRPIAVAPGMDLNALLAFVIVGQMGYTWQFSLTAFFISGLIYMLLALTPLHRKIFQCFPPMLKNAISVGTGLFIAFIGLRTAGIVIDSPDILIALGDLSSPASLVTVIGILTVALMLLYNVKGALLIGIFVSALLGIPLGVTSFENIVTPELFALPSLESTFMKFEWEHVFSYDMLLLVSIFLFVDIFDTTGTFISLATKGKWFDENGTMPRARGAFLADAFGTVFGAMLGTSPGTSYIESSTGMMEKGKTGLTSCVVAVLFLLSLFFAPVFLLVPIQSSSVALVMVGVFMISPISEIDFSDYLYAIPSFAIILMMPLSCSIADGIMIGVTTFVFLAFCSGRTKDLSTLTTIVALIGVIKLMLFH